MKECVSEHIQMLCMEDTAFVVPNSPPQQTSLPQQALLHPQVPPLHQPKQSYRQKPKPPILGQCLYLQAAQAKIPSLQLKGFSILKAADESNILFCCSIAISRKTPISKSPLRQKWHGAGRYTTLSMPIVCCSHDTYKVSRSSITK